MADAAHTAHPPLESLFISPEFAGIPAPSRLLILDRLINLDVLLGDHLHQRQLRT
jgi:hypothetical protein